MKTKKKDVNNNNLTVKNLDDIITTLRSLIDQIDSNFREAKDLILELARRLDEEAVCERGRVCRKIKNILEEKIRQGKITEKWIEECLPSEYKRRYTKSELSSLSKQDAAAKKPSDQPLIQVGNAGDEVIADGKADGEADLMNEIQGQKGTEFEDQQNNLDVMPENDSEAYTVLIKNPELRILKTQLEFMIHREKYEGVREAMEKSTDFIYMLFDQLGTFIHARPGVLKEHKIR
jgi:hypothetical protein